MDSRERLIEATAALLQRDGYDLYTQSLTDQQRLIREGLRPVAGR